MKDKIWLFVLAIRSVDNEIQMFRPESLMAEIKDSHSCSSRKKSLTVHSVICYKTFALIRAKKQEEMACSCQKEGDSLVFFSPYEIVMNKIIKIIKTRVLIDFFISMLFILSSCRNSCEIGNIIAYPAEADSVDMKQSGLLCKHPTITIGAINFQNNDLLEVKLVKKDKGVAILLFFIKNGRVHKVKSQIIDKDKIYAFGASKDICEYYSNNKKWFLLISCKNDIVYIVWNKKEAGMCPFYMNSKHDYIYRKIRVKGVNFHVL